MDMTFHALLYLVWAYPDGSIYTLGTAAWSVVFRANKTAGGGWDIAPESVVAAGERRVPDHGDPAKTVGASYNTNWAWGWVP
jgi:hypothetical protein